MVDAWTNCTDCGHRYGSWIGSCPRCGRANSSYNGSMSRPLGTKKIALIAGICIVIAFGALIAIGAGGGMQSRSPSSVGISDSVTASGGSSLGSSGSAATNSLVAHALAKINEDRTSAGLAPVKLSTNGAAQAHAEDVLRTGVLSHWMTNGEKPFMTYTRYGGTGSVSQNVANSKTYLDPSGQAGMSSSKCTILTCSKLDPIKAIDSLEHSMVYDDLDCCSDGHKHNILDRFHTDVSVGVAYDDFTLALVQNFENNYIQFNKPVVKEQGGDRSHIQLAGTFPKGKFEGIEIFYDKSPSPAVYEDNKARREYGLGQHVASVVEPWWMKQYQKPSDYILIPSDSWSVNKDAIDINFDISSTVNKAGVYTVVIYMTDDKGDEFQASNYSILYDAPLK